MDQTTKFNPCAVCVSHGKPVFAVLLILLGLKMLAEQFSGNKNQPQEA